MFSVNVEEPKGNLYPSNIEPIQVIREMPYKEVNKIDNNVFVYDFKQIFVGWVSIKVQGYSQYAQYTNEKYRSEGTYIYYNEYGSLLTASQVLVTYEYDNNQVKAKASYQGEKLPKTMNKLVNKEDFTLLVHGDSVCVGLYYCKRRKRMVSWRLAES